MAATQSIDVPTVESRRDEELSARVHEALQRYDPIRTSDSPIQVICSDGLVTLRGVTRTRPMKRMAEVLARRVPGVREVRNELVSDTDLETEVALELGMNERLRKAGGRIRVKSILGVLYLEGDIAAETLEEAEELKALAEEIAGKVEGVIRVVSFLTIREEGREVTTAAEEPTATAGPSAEVEAKLAELRERRQTWAERARK